MSILKLKPSSKDYIWGGKRLAEEYGKEMTGNTLAETWELSCHEDGPCYITGGIYNGLTLQQFIDKKGSKVLGTNCKKFEQFPILIKFIDAQDNLSYRNSFLICFKYSKFVEISIFPPIYKIP